MQDSALPKNRTLYACLNAHWELQALKNSIGRSTIDHSRQQMFDRDRIRGFRSYGGPDILEAIFRRIENESFLPLDIASQILVSFFHPTADFLQSQDAPLDDIRVRQVITFFRFL